MVDLAQGKKLGFVTNNSSKSRQEYMQRFQKLGMTVYEVKYRFNGVFHY